MTDYEGNQDPGFLEFFEKAWKFRAQFYAQARKRGRSHEDAEDLVQRLYFNVCRSWKQCAGDNIGAWLWAIMRRISIDTYRSRKSEELALEHWSEAQRKRSKDASRTAFSPALPAHNTSLDSIDLFLHHAVTDQVREQFWRLPPQAHKVLLLTIQERDDLEIAEALGCAQTTVRAHRHFARKALRKVS